VATEKTPRRLGRGLEALLGNAGGLASSDEGALKSIPIGQIGRNPFQPRREFNSEELGELQESLNSSGLLQPITVRRRPGKDGFELIAGERRLRAAMKLGWKEIPAIIKDIDDKTVLTLALVENLTDLPMNLASRNSRLRKRLERTERRSPTCSASFSCLRLSESCCRMASSPWGTQRSFSGSKTQL